MEIKTFLEKTKEIKIRLDRATLGPWQMRIRQGSLTHPTLCDVMAHNIRIAELGVDPALHDEGTAENIRADAEFITLARDDIKFLLDGVVILSRLVDDLSRKSRQSED